jgi:hypothetical protein
LLKVPKFVNGLRGAEGAEIAEAALVMPLVIMLIFGIIWFGRAFNIYSTIQQAAQQGALVAARSSCATCGDTSAPVGSVTTCPETGTPGSVAYTVAAVMCASSIDPTQIQLPVSAPSCGGSTSCAGCVTVSKIYICQNAVVTGITPAQKVAVVSFQYPFKINFPGTSLNMQHVILSAQAQSRLEN